MTESQSIAVDTLLAFILASALLCLVTVETYNMRANLLAKDGIVLNHICDRREND